MVHLVIILPMFPIIYNSPDFAFYLSIYIECELEAGQKCSFLTMH